MNIINKFTRRPSSSSSTDFTVTDSFSRRPISLMNNYFPSSEEHSRCSHCGKSYCQIDFIFSWLSRHRNSNEQQDIVDQRIQEMISKRLPTADPQNVCEQRLLHWYHSMRDKENNPSTHFDSSTTRSVVSPSSLVSHHEMLSTDYNQYLLSQSAAFPPEDPLFSSQIYERLSSSMATQTFSTQNQAGLYQLCSNGRYIIADDWCLNYKGHRLSQWMRCLTIYNQYEEQCVLMLPEFNTMTQNDAVQSMTWNEQLQVFLFITYNRVYQCEPESGTINQIHEYEIPSIRHSLSHIACDQESSVFLAYQYPHVSLDLWHISSMFTWSLIKRWTPRELFPPPKYTDHDDDDDDDEQIEEEKNANHCCVCDVASMCYSNGKLHFLARHERHWSLHIFSLVINVKHQKLIPQRRIDIDLSHLRFAGENYQMEILPGEQGWLFAIRRPYLIHLDYNGQNARKVLLATSKRCADSISNVCIMDERGKRRENGKHLVVRDANSIRFYKL